MANITTAENGVFQLHDNEGNTYLTRIRNKEKFQTADKIYWHCERKGCSGRAITLGNQVLTWFGIHKNHTVTEKRDKDTEENYVDEMLVITKKTTLREYLYKDPGYIYGIKNTHASGKVVWRCNRYYYKCSATAYTMNGKVCWNNDHTHPPQSDLDTLYEFPNSSE